MLLSLALADITLVIHLLFVLFVAVGGFLVLRWRWIARRTCLQRSRGGFIEIYRSHLPAHAA